MPSYVLISGNISQHTSYSLIFSPLHRIINGEQHEKYLYNQSSHCKNTEFEIVKHAPQLSINKVGVLLNHTLCFQLF